MDPQTGSSIAADVSPIAVLLSEEGLDFDHSSVVTVEETTRFQLNFSHTNFEHLSASGRYNRSSKSLNLQLDYVYRSTDQTQVPPVSRSFEVQVRLSVSEVRSRAFSPFIEKEDILAMVRRFLGDLANVASQEGASLGGVEFNQEDINEIYMLDNGRLARSLENLIHLLMLFARLKEILDGDREGEILAPVRGESDRVQVTEGIENITSLKISVREILGKTDPGPENGAEAALASNKELPGGDFAQPEGPSPVPATLS